MSLGLMQSENDEANFRKYFPHAVSHGLGVDVHESLGAPRFFQPGMLLTVEPGIYIPSEGIGVRIEDDILVTEKGHSNLSARLSTDL
jgi:Xaa-Pro aminopeptidase